MVILIFLDNVHLAEGCISKPASEHVLHMYYMINMNVFDNLCHILKEIGIVLIRLEILKALVKNVRILLLNIDNFDIWVYSA